jgi:hypothetical protein
MARYFVVVPADRLGPHGIVNVARPARILVASKRTSLKQWRYGLSRLQLFALVCHAARLQLNVARALSVGNSRSQWKELVVAGEGFEPTTSGL